MHSSPLARARSKSNLPGSRRERQLLRSFARMAGELLRFSSDPAKAMRFPERLRTFHKPDLRLEHQASAPAAPTSALALWDDEDAVSGFKRTHDEAFDDDADDGKFDDVFGDLF